jgi:hypothetical protein
VNAVDTTPARIISNVVVGSVGWGIAHHESHALRAIAVRQRI